MHKTWAEKNVDQTGSVWRLYGRWARIRNPNLDKEYRLRKKARMMYKPLPESLTIQQSGIDGLGLFAKEDIMGGKNFGMSHIKLNGNMVRTPLGGFINHSDTPNTVILAGFVVDLRKLKTQTEQFSSVYGSIIG